MFTWQVLHAVDGRIETVEHYETLAEVIWEMANSSWEEPSNGWLSYIVDDDSGEVVATAMFGPEPGLELLVTLADGRQLRLPMPLMYQEFYASELAASHNA